MDPMSFLLGFTRVLVPPMAPPIVETTPKPPVTNLGLDRDLLKAIYADSRVQGGGQAQAGGQGQAAGGGEAQGAQQAQEAPQVEQAQEVQKVREASRVGSLDASDVRAVDDPLMVTAMKAIYADRLTLGGTAYERQLAVLLAATTAALPWER